jgi:5S rRNA maturation endonuclease (ribonuclease M5)
MRRSLFFPSGGCFFFGKLRCQTNYDYGTTEEDDTLVNGGAAIDLLSFATLHPSATSRYVSTGGALNPSQPELIKRAAAKLPEGAKVILAMDHDEAGEKLAGEIQGHLATALAVGATVSGQRPQGRGETGMMFCGLQMAKESKNLELLKQLPISPQNITRI